MSQDTDILQLLLPSRGEYLSYGMDALQFGELRLPRLPGPFPAAIVIHGGFWRAAYNLDHIGHLCLALNAVGIATWSVEYRRLGNAGGGWPGTFEDVAAAARHLDSIAGRYNLDREHFVAIGHSAGGQLALWLASQHRLRGVVSLAGVTDLRRAYELGLSNSVVRDLFQGSPDSVPERYDRYSPIEQVPLSIPQRLIHGSLDKIVPLEISKRYVDRARACGDDAELLALENAGHFELIDPRTNEFEVVRNTILKVSTK